MADIQTTPKQFTTIAYVTKDGEKCTATKNNGIVTVQGDKNGVRQVPVDEFMKELAATLPKVDLARTPAQDTVQFKGGEEKTAEGSSVVTEPNHKARNWAIGIGTTVATLIGLGVAGRHGYLGKGIQKFLGGAEKDAGKLADDLTGAAEHTNPHATTETSEISAQEFEQIANRETDFVYGGTKTTEKTAEEAAAGTGSKVEETVTAAEAKTETVTANQAETLKPEPKLQETSFRPTTHLSQEEIFTLPKDLETDPAKVLELGYKKSDGRKIYCRTPDNKRTYILTKGENPQIERVLDYTQGQIAPFRTIEFKDGLPHAIHDNTTSFTHVKHLSKEEIQAAKAKQVKTQPKAEPAKPAQKPTGTEAAQPKKAPEPQKNEEIARQQQQLEDDLARQQRETERLRREQEEIINNDIINAGVAAEMIGAAGRKAAEKAGEATTKGVDKIVEQMAKEADKAAETVAKADVPKVGTVLEETASAAGKTEASAAETIVNSSEKAGDDLFAQNSTDGLFTPKASDELYTPGDGYLTSTERLADDITPETTRTSFLDDTVDEFGLPKSTLDDVTELETSNPSFLDDTVDEFGMPKFDSFEDDIARMDDPIDSFGSSGFDDGFDFM